MEKTRENSSILPGTANPDLSAGSFYLTIARPFTVSKPNFAYRP
jgi:hypothetical protein